MNVYIYQNGTEKELKNAYIGEYHEHTTTTYTADFSTFTPMTTAWGGNPVIQDGYVTSTYEGGIIYKDISSEFVLNNPKEIILEYDVYWVGKARSNNDRCYFLPSAPNNKVSGDSTMIGSSVPVQNTSGYNTGHFLYIGGTWYAQTTAGAWVNSNAWNTVKIIYDIDNLTGSVIINNTEKWNGSIITTGTDFPNLKYLSIFVETNNRIRNVKLTVTQ